MVLLDLLMRVPFTMVNNTSSENEWLVISKYLVLSASPVGVLVMLDTPEAGKVVELLLLNTIPIAENSIEYSKKIAKAKMIAREPIAQTDFSFVDCFTAQNSHPTIYGFDWANIVAGFLN
jgi:hypothetical protein